MRFSRIFVPGALLCAMLLAGCGGSGRLNTKGRILKGGEPFTVPKEDVVRVIFFPFTEDGSNPANTYIATFNPSDGTFVAFGPDGKGIPPGKYRISLTHEVKKRDLFKGNFEGESSPFVFEVNSGTKEIVIDLEKT